MSEEMETSEEGWGHSQKPLPLQRILLENGQVSRIKPLGKGSPSSPKQSMYDKENIQLLTKITEKKVVSMCTLSTVKELCETSEWTTHEAMSSTLAVQQSCLSTPERLKPSLFSASNLSSISLLVNASGFNSLESAPSPQDGKFKTPNRKEDIGSNLGVFNTPSSGSSRTPSSNSRTPSSKGTRTPGSGSSAWSSGIRYNPFESNQTADHLHLPTVSPRVFAVVASPSEETMNGRFWSIEQQAELYPAPISDDSPYKQSIIHRHYSHDTESKAQEQIELYFSNYHDVTSPPDLPPTGPLILDSPADKDASYTLPDSGKTSKWTQTCITLPPILPAPVEHVLRQYNFITDVYEEQNNLSNSTLRRKLFNVDMYSDLDDSQRQSSSEEEDESSPFKVLTPGKVMRTPVTSKPGNSAQWSSSPVRGKYRTSISSPDLNSPMFSPIARNKPSSSSSLEESSIHIEEVDAGTDTERNATSAVEERETSELYETAEVQEMTETSCINMDTDSNSAAAWGLTLPTQGEDSNNTESRVDTGYTTSTVSSIQPSALQDSGQPSVFNMDSGVSTSQQPDLTVSLILPQAALNPLPVLNPVLMSYAAENTNDISVGFPLGSSTPTKR